MSNVGYLLESVPKMQGRRILIIGDVGVDEYVIGNVKRISPEAPVPILDVSSEETRLGLSSNVAQNVSSLGSTPLLVSVVGDDKTADVLRTQLQAAGVSSEYLVVDSKRPTTRKLRVMAQHHHIVRVDFEQSEFLSPDVEAKVLARVDELIAGCDGVIVQDYAKGVLSETCIQGVIKRAKKHGKRVVVDPNKGTPLSFYRGGDVMTPNYDESLALAGVLPQQLRQVSRDMHEVGAVLLKGIESDRVIITRGKDGMSLFENGKIEHIPTFALQVADVTGAGDTVAAALTCAWVGGLDLKTSCILANYAAGHVVSKVGCVPCTKDELVAFIRSRGDVEAN